MVGSFLQEFRKNNSQLFCQSSGGHEHFAPQVQKRVDQEKEMGLIQFSLYLGAVTKWRARSQNVSATGALTAHPGARQGYECVSRTNSDISQSAKLLGVISS